MLQKCLFYSFMSFENAHNKLVSVIMFNSTNRICNIALTCVTKPVRSCDETLFVCLLRLSVC